MSFIILSYIHTNLIKSMLSSQVSLKKYIINNNNIYHVGVTHSTNIHDKQANIIRHIFAKNNVNHVVIESLKTNHVVNKNTKECNVINEMSLAYHLANINNANIIGVEPDDSYYKEKFDIKFKEYPNLFECFIYLTKLVIATNNNTEFDDINKFGRIAQMCKKLGVFVSEWNIKQIDTFVCPKKKGNILNKAACYYYTLRDVVIVNNIFDFCNKHTNQNILIVYGMVHYDIFNHAYMNNKYIISEEDVAKYHI